MFSYYRRFIKDFAAIAAPLHALTKQERSGQSQRTLKKEAKTTWSEGVWTQEHQKAFVKGALLCRPVLVLPRKDRHWRLATDASIVAMGEYDDGNIEHPIGYYSRKLIDTETGSWSWVRSCGHLRFADRTFVEFISSW